MELKEKLQLEKMPRKIESFDISNIAGQYIVAGMCVMKDGVINRKLSRRFRIKNVVGQDDPKCMEEVVTRRLKHSIESPNGGFGALPKLCTNTIWIYQSMEWLKMINIVPGL